MRMRKKQFQAGHFAAFTIVELIVVIGILALLASILFAVISRARESGRSTTCQNNLKQLAIAIQLYVQDSDSHYPAPRWVNAISPLVRQQNVFFCPTHSSSDTNGWGSYMYNFPRLSYTLPKEPATKRLRGRSEVQVIDASRIWLNADEDTFGGSGQKVSMCDRDMTWFTLHSGGANYSFADGHIKWLAPEMISKIECSLDPLPEAHG